MMTAFIAILFILGYVAIVFEHNLKINKAATALVTGVLCWTVYILFNDDKEAVVEQLSHHLGDLSQILFFLMGAMAIVELVDAHDGFEIITQRITTSEKRKLLWIIALLSFFLSAVLDNLTTTIVMVSLIRKLVANKNDRWVLIGLVIIASNAGGAWSPIGDVSTTMLWIGGQVSADKIILRLFFPSLVCLLLPLLILLATFKGKVERPVQTDRRAESFSNTARDRKIIFLTGLLVLLMVPVFKAITHLPPFMGIMMGLGIVWIVAEVLQNGNKMKEKSKFSVAVILRKIDTSSILFFFGILLTVSALASTGQLAGASVWMDNHLKDQNIIVMSIGVLSAVVDNVPLVAAAQGMYDLSVYPQDHYFWEFLAYCAGTGGSILIIGSAAGVAAMGLENINFMWYLKRLGLLAFLGYMAGAAVFIFQYVIIGL